MIRIIKEDWNLIEKKDHLIKRHSDFSDLTSQQQQELLDFFKQKDQPADMNIDWNKLNSYDIEEILQATKVQTKSQRKKQVKLSGIQALDEGKDYIEVYNHDGVIGLMPLTFEASKFIASKYIGGCEGEWCTAYQKNSKYWTGYTEKGIVLIYFIDFENNDKAALALNASSGDKEWFDADDRKIKFPDFIEEDEETLDAVFEAEEKAVQNQNKIISKVPLKDRLGIFINGTYEIDSRGFVNVDGDVELGSENLTSFEGTKFGFVSGVFSCNNNNLTSLEGSPKEVGRSFFCDNNNLTSLKGSPEKVGGDFVCRSNKLMTILEGSPKEVGGDFDCFNNNLTTLEGSPEKVGGDFKCRNNNLTNLEGSPKEVGGDFYCRHNNLTTLEGSPEKVGGDFYCRHNNLTNLDGSPKEVGGNFDCFNNNLISLDGSPKEVGGNFDCSSNNLPDPSILYSNIRGKIKSDVEIIVKDPRDKR